jgi:hypothetical protein
MHADFFAPAKLDHSELDTKKSTSSPPSGALQGAPERAGAAGSRAPLRGAAERPSKAALRLGTLREMGDGRPSHPIDPGLKTRGHRGGLRPPDGPEGPRRAPLTCIDRCRSMGWSRRRLLTHSVCSSPPDPWPPATCVLLRSTPSVPDGTLSRVRMRARTRGCASTMVGGQARRPASPSLWPTLSPPTPWGVRRKGGCVGLMADRAGLRPALRVCVRARG